jgi:hypothetical protein
MPRLNFLVILASLLTLSVSNVLAADLKRGKQLHDQNCMSCHREIMTGAANGIYTREQRRIENWPDLLKQVGRCNENLDLPWPDDEVHDVARYLNTKFYHFEDTH